MYPVVCLQLVIAATHAQPGAGVTSGVSCHGVIEFD